MRRQRRFWTNSARSLVNELYTILIFSLWLFASCPSAEKFTKKTTCTTSHQLVVWLAQKVASSKVGIMAQAPVCQSPAKGTSVMVMFWGWCGVWGIWLQGQIFYLLAASRRRRPLPRTRRRPQPFQGSRMILNVNKLWRTDFDMRDYYQLLTARLQQRLKGKRTKAGSSGSWPSSCGNGRHRVEMRSTR